MKNDNMNQFFPGTLAVGKSVESPNVNATNLNGTPVDQYIKEDQICEPSTLKGFYEQDGGLMWNGVKLIPPNSIMEDRAYTSDEMLSLVDKLWE